MTDIIQGTPEWHSIRCGKATASRIADVIAKTKSGWGASRANYLGQLVAERLTGNVAEQFTNAAMAHGTATEPAARTAYEFYTNATVLEIGFVDHPTIAMSGASPDGLVNDNGLVEIKCPQTSTHIETLLGATVPAKYLTQINWQLACTGRQWCDFVSFDPRMPEEMSIFVKRVERDQAAIDELEKLVSAFLAEVQTKVDALTARYAAQEAA